MAACLNNLGILLKHQGDYDGSRDYLQRALAMYEALYPKSRYPQGHPDLASGLYNLGALLKAQGDYTAARGYCQRALAMNEALFPKETYPQGHPGLVSRQPSIDG